MAANIYKTQPEFLDYKKTVKAIVTTANISFDSKDVAEVRKAAATLAKLRSELSKYDSSTWRQSEIERRTAAITQEAISNPDKIANTPPRNPAEEIAKEISHHLDLENHVRKDLGLKLGVIGKRMFPLFIGATRKLMENQHAYEIGISEKFGVAHKHSNFLGCLEKIISDYETTLAYVTKGKGIDPSSFDGLV